MKEEFIVYRWMDTKHLLSKIDRSFLWSFDMAYSTRESVYMLTVPKHSAKFISDSTAKQLIQECLNNNLKQGKFKTFELERTV